MAVQAQLSRGQLQDLAVHCCVVQRRVTGV